MLLAVILIPPSCSKELSHLNFGMESEEPQRVLIWGIGDVRPIAWETVCFAAQPAPCSHGWMNALRKRFTGKKI